MDRLLITTKLKENFPLVREQVTNHPKKAAVLVVLFPMQNSICLLMTKRARHLKHHPGEISFPGGMIEKKDRDLIKTALRETKEEVGLELGAADVIARLPTVMTLTGFEVAPYVTMMNRIPQAKPSSEEVEEVLEIPLIPLLATRQKDLRFQEAGEDMFVYLYEHHKIWGASAKILWHIEKLNLI